MGWYTFVWKFTCNHARSVRGSTDHYIACTDNCFRFKQAPIMFLTTHLGRLEWIIRREVNFDHEHAACIWAIRRSAAEKHMALAKEVLSSFFAQA